MRQFLRQHLSPDTRRRVRAPSRLACLVSAQAWLRVNGDRRLPSALLLRMLRYGWGNESFSATPAYLRLVAEHARSTSGAVVEAGCGLSTILLSYALPTERRLVAFEHEARWAQRVNRWARRGTIPAIHAPLVSYDDHDWYETGSHLPDEIGFVICDGPPSWTRGGRFGALPRLAARLKDGAVILVDDSNRPTEQQALERWAAEFGVTYTIDNSAPRGCAVVIVPKLNNPDGQRSHSE